uniref:Uncharacterized protein n=1 Tax=Siphoviridae sp. ctBLh2 TaxID=2827803 RepID=A0A8S5S3I8_9CAUD|nr:MAG TPA: hypothetical protein [Siphoviridae sp. ctBLh2]
MKKDENFPLPAFGNSNRSRVYTAFAGNQKKFSEIFVARPKPETEQIVENRRLSICG